MNKQNPQAAQSMNGYNGTVRASVGNKQLGGSVFLNGQQGKLSYSANVMTSYNKPGNTTTEMEQIQDNGASQILTSDNDLKTPFTMGSLTLGYQLDYDYHQYGAMFPEGSRIVLYTDGILESRNKDHQMMGMQYLLSIINSHYTEPVNEMTANIMKDTHHYIGSS